VVGTGEVGKDTSNSSSRGTREVALCRPVTVKGTDKVHIRLLLLLLLHKPFRTRVTVGTAGTEATERPLAGHRSLNTVLVVAVVLAGTSRLLHLHRFQHRKAATGRCHPG
jgi:hypothetical protein